ncbi:glycosyltransferase family 39 protein [Streptomyces sp. NBC_00124]|uniref:ArnT family glycosyltransferase n=1 Tax=Streptomyces sp. NBC_00124 TaxID=2975662 RepID=UPI00224F1F66|nr:glycosyltransferase family 39 protein [Streptomyces sp. NBC_00124]MCX5363398.1 glycosyltransferase family 39 protein [Streptomyces sp. NBC_00124]
MTSATDPHPHTDTAVSADRPPPAPPAATPDKAPRWSLPALLAILVLAAVLYSWNLSGSSLNSFYSAAVLSGTQSWKAWFFGSLDAGNFLTVDKPPFALMVMGLSCRLFGFGTWQMMLPMILTALGTIWIVHASVKRVWGHVAATVAALVLALTPITVAIDRDNNPDTLLVFLMAAGAALALRATRDGKLLPLLCSAACFGLAFNTKMLQGYIPLPIVFAVYLYAAEPKLVKRIVNLLLAGVVLAVSSFWWAAAVSLVPADDRPYIGGSTDGSAWNLIMGYNGLGRIFGGEGNGGGGGGGGGFSGTAGLGRLFNDVLGGQISWLIPFAAIALIGGLVLCGRAPRTDMTRAALVMWGGWTGLHYLTFAMAEGTMHPYYTTALAPGIAALCGGGGVMLLRAFRADKRWAWVLPLGLAVTAIWAAVLLRRASGWNTWLWPTILVVMALAIVGLLVFRSGGNGNKARLLAASLAAAVVASVAGPAAYAWSVPSGSGGGMGGTNPTAGPSTGSGGFGGGGGGRGGMPGGTGGGPGGTQQGGRNSQAGGQTEGGFPGGGQNGEAPGGGNGELPSGGQAGGGTPPGGTGENGTSGDTQNGQSGQGGQSGPGGMTGGGGMGGGGMGGGASSELVSYLKKHQDGATWLLAVSSSQSAAQLIMSSGEPVISMWGWSGSDQAMTLARLKELVKAGRLHYIQLGSGGMGGGPGGGSSLSTEVTEWVQKNGTAVKESEYSSNSTSGTSGSSSSSDSSDSSNSSNTATVYRLDASDVG